MNHYCTGCGAGLAPQQRFCASCGRSLAGKVGTVSPVADDLPDPAEARPPGQPEAAWSALRSRRVWPYATVVALLIVATVVVTTLVRGPRSTPITAPPPESAVAVPASVAAGRGPVRAGSPAPTATTELSAAMAAGAGQVSALDGSWVAQISSKRVGLVADGITYDQDAILGDFRRSAARFPRAVLFESGRFATFTSSGFYVTVIAIPFPSAGQANAWCTRAALPANACFAKRLSSTPVSGTTVVHR